MRLTSSRENVDYTGQYNQFRNVSVLPRPVQQPIPIWVVSNPDLKKKRNAESGYRRVARLGDGWMTTLKSPPEVRQSIKMIHDYAADEGRSLGEQFEVCVYYNINVNDNRDIALDESKRFLDSYYSVNYHRELIEAWVAMGSPAECIRKVREYIDAGATTITLRLTGYDQKHQFKRVTEEVLPALL
jgi:alkanesulfonate monooxygenase SsuD/methylene tetrahydromethanopterin reductase-like flavin-dependent oxidoreductase (luciferase family)